MAEKEEKFMLISMEDEKSKKIAEAIGNKTCRKITNLLAETDKRELSETDISQELKLPVNTVEYNLKKLVDAGLIEKSKNFFWSRKGKKIPMYKLSKKLVVIAPKSSSNILRGLIPAAIVSFVGAFILRSYFSMKTSFIQRAQFETEKIITAVEDGAAAGSAETVSGAAQTAYAAASNYWLFFLLGALFALVIYLILNWRKFK